MMLRIWICKECKEEFHYDDDTIEKVFCKCGEEMELITKLPLS